MFIFLLFFSGSYLGGGDQWGCRIFRLLLSPSNSCRSSYFTLVNLVLDRAFLSFVEVGFITRARQLVCPPILIAHLQRLQELAAFWGYF